VFFLVLFQNIFSEVSTNSSRKWLQRTPEVPLESKPYNKIDYHYNRVVTGAEFQNLEKQSENLGVHGRSDWFWHVPLPRTVSIPIKITHYIIYFNIIQLTSF
jgi:hypothetical protein